MYLQFLSGATLGHGVLALSIVANAFGAGSLAYETPRPEASSLPTPAAKPQKTTSFEALLSECVARYKRGATNTKEACDRAIAASGLTGDAFAAAYGSRLVRPAPKTEKPASTTTPEKPAPTTKPEKPASTTKQEKTTVSFEALLSECVARYKRGATNTKEACDRAIAASGLSTEAFVSKYRTLLVPPTKTETPKPTMTPKPTTAPKLNTSDPKVKECLAKYEVLKSLKASGAQTFDAALKYFTTTCKSVLEARG